MVRVVRSGRQLARELELRHPALYRELGRPRPGYFESLRRSTYNRYVMGRAYEALPDPALVARFDAQRRREQTLLGVSLACLAGLGLLALGARLAGW